MESAQFNFFATRGDLLGVASRLESTHRVDYVKLGLFDHSVATRYHTCAEIPGIGLTDSPGSPTYDHRYMLIPSGSNVETRNVPQRKGGMKYAVDMVANRDSVELSPGGIYTGEQNVLVIGRAATLASSEFSVGVYKYMLQLVRREFRKVGWIYVGPEAADHYREGWRLVRDSRLPDTEDLKLSH